MPLKRRVISVDQSNADPSGSVLRCVVDQNGIPLWVNYIDKIFENLLERISTNKKLARKNQTREIQVRKYNGAPVGR